MASDFRIPAIVSALALGIAAWLVPGASARERPSAAVIVEQELAFARAAAARGTRAAFLEYLADSAVLLAPAPQPARAAYEKLASPGAPLLWRPDLAMLAGGGDFGWASGPFTAYLHSPSERPDESGHYLTVWRRQDDGAWRVVLDGGVAYPVADELVAARLAVKPRLRSAGGGGAGRADCSAEFAALWQAKGRAKALKEYLADDARLLYGGLPPRDGEAINPKSDPLARTTLEATHLARRLASDAGDVVVAYGDYRIAATLETPPRRLQYVQAWDVGRKCRLALELASSVGSN